MSFVNLFREFLLYLSLGMLGISALAWSVMLASRKTLFVAKCLRKTGWFNCLLVTIGVAAMMAYGGSKPPLTIPSNLTLTLGEGVAGATVMIGDDEYEATSSTNFWTYVSQEVTLTDISYSSGYTEGMTTVTGLTGENPYTVASGDNCSIEITAVAMAIVDWTYEVVDGGAVITGTTQTSGDIVIPSEIDGYPVTGIGSSAFFVCRGLTSVTIPDGVTSIGYSAFSNCSGLTSVTIPNSVISIGRGAFNGCRSLTSLTIPDGVTSIGDSAFSSCSGLTSVTIGNDVTSIGDYAFNNCSGLASINVGVNNPKYKSVDGLLLSKDGSILIRAKNASEVIIPNSVTRIENSAFSGYSGLTSVTIPDGVISIGRGAFNGCNDSLFDTNTVFGVKLVDGWAVGPVESFIWHLDLSGARGIANYAFEYCGYFDSVTIPEGIVNVPVGAFANCGTLRSVVLPQGVTSIGNEAFYECTSLIDIIIPDSVTIIGKNAFYDCYNLGTLSLPDSVTSIGDFAFANCFGLWDFTLSNNVTNLGVCAFYNSGLGSIALPECIENIGEGAFSGCRDLYSIWVAPGNARYSSIDGQLLTKDGKTLIRGTANGAIPSSVVFIGDDAFSGCGGLTSVAIPEGVVSIGHTAFYECMELSSVTIPASVTNIGYFCFYGSALTDVTFLGNAPIVESRAFDNIYADAAVVHVPYDATGFYVDENGMWNGLVVEYSMPPPEIRNVTAKQRYPWNGKVDITYEVVGDVMAGIAPEDRVLLAITATDVETGEGYVAGVSALSGDTNTLAGAHHVIWDMDAQGIALKSTNVVFSVAYRTVQLYCVVDLSGGADATSYPVTYLTDVPSGGWTDEYKTTKLVLRRIEPGTFTMGCETTEVGYFGDEAVPHEVTITEPFYMGVFEVTQKQYELVTGSNPSSYKGDMRPVEYVSWDNIRGDSSTYNWPSSLNVDASTFMGKLRAKTGISTFDLPTEAKWEYACRAGTTSIYNNGGDSEDDLKLVGRYSGNKSDGKGDYSDAHTTVGSYMPNAWGLYDMHGNVLEWTLDWYQEGSSFTSAAVTDPVGPASGGNRVLRGGCWYDDARYCRSADRDWYIPGRHYDYFGFRLCCSAGPLSAEGERSPEAVAGAERAEICSGESATVAVDSTVSEGLTLEAVTLTWDASWIGGDAGATVVIADNGAEIKRATGAGEFIYALSGTGVHGLTYTTYIDNVAQDEVYTAIVNIVRDINDERVIKAFSPESFVYSGAANRPTVQLTDMDALPNLNVVAYAPGDVDGNGVLSQNDRTLIQRYNAYQSLSDSQKALFPSYNLTGSALSAADVNCDGVVNADDVAALDAKFNNHERDLVEGIDYTLAYANNVNPGTGAATVTGIGNYFGTVVFEFTIAKATIGGEPGSGAVPEGGASKFDTTCIYDGLSHTLDVDALSAVRLASGEVPAISYSLNGIDGWQTEPFAFTEACTTSVWYRIQSPNYEDYIHEVRVTVAPRSITDETISSVLLYDPDSGDEASALLFDRNIPRQQLVAPYAAGDVDGDGELTYDDIDRIEQYLGYLGLDESVKPFFEEYDLTGAALAAADYNGDGVVDDADMDELEASFYYVLETGTDYTVEVGFNTVTVCGIGNYCGVLKKVFRPAEMRNVTAVPRIPWDGRVDISFEVLGDVAADVWYAPVLSVTATNRVDGSFYVATAAALSGDTGIEEGTHHVVWDLEAQGLSVRSDNVVVTVAYVEEIESLCSGDSAPVAIPPQFVVSVDGVETVYSHGDSVTFTAPEPHEADGMQIVAVGTTFTAPVVTNEFTVTVTNNIDFAWDIFATNWWFNVADTQNGFVIAPEAAWMAGGTNFVMTAVPAEHYHFVGWTGDTNGCTVTDGTLEVTMDQPRTIGAEFAIDTFEVSFEAGVHGTLSGTTVQTIDHGATAAVPQVEPNAGYRFVGWSGDVTAPVVGDVTFTAQYEAIQYVITYTGLKGATNPNPATYTIEDAITFAAPGDVYGWVFKGWAPATIALGSIGDVAVSANWERQKFDVTINGVTTQYSYEDEVTFTAPEPWDADGMQVVTLGTTFTDPVVTNEFTVTVTSSIDFVWDIFATNWWFDVAETQNGSIVAPDAGWMADGTNFVLSVEPSEHYHFAGWTGDTNGCAVTDGTLEVTMDQPRTIGAEFAIDTFEVTFEAGAHGTLSGTTSQTIDYGATATVPDVTPDAGYVFVGWSGDVTAPVVGDVTFTAQYAAIPYAIVYNGLKGATNPNPATYTIEDAVTFAAPGDVYGWVFTGWTPATIALGSVGDVEVSASWERAKFDVTVNGETRQYSYEDEVTFTAPEPQEADGMQIVTLGTTFTDPVVTNEFTVTVTSSIDFVWDIFATNWWFDVAETQNGSIIAPESGWMADGTNFVLTAVPADHYHFVGWTGDTNGCIVADGPLEVTMDQPRTIGAEFAIDTYTVTFNLDGKAARTGGGELEQTIAHGAAAEAPVVEPFAGWLFNGWDAAFDEVTGDVMVNAVFERVRHDIRIVNPDGSVSETVGVEYGTSMTFTAPEPQEADGMQIVAVGTTFTAPVVTNEFTVTVTNNIDFVWDIFATNWWFAVAEMQNGAVVAPESGWMADGTNFVLTAVPADHYHFVGWTGDTNGCAVTEGTLEVTMASPRTIGAEFAIDTYTVIFDLDGKAMRTGGGELEQTVAHGGAADAPLVEPIAGWLFDGWVESFDCVTGDMTVRAAYSRVHNDVVVVAPDGSVTTNDVEYGECVTFTAPEPWEADGRQVVSLGTTFTAPVVTNEFSATVTEAFSFSWDILATNWWFAVAETQNGAVVAPESGWMSDGTNFVLTAVPADHYHFTGWTGDTNGCAVADGTLEVTMDSPRTIGAEFAIDTFSVSFEAGAHGTLSGTTAQTIDYGATAAVPEVEPNAGYRFIGWSDDVTALVVSNATFTAQYETVPYAITYNGLKGATNDNPLTYTVEDEITFGAPGDVYGWMFKSWSPASIALGSIGDVAVMANWERQKFDVTVNGETRQYDYEEVVTFATNAVINCGTTQYVCKGWTATNADPESGEGASAEFRVLGDVSLDWQWVTNFVTLAQSVNADDLDWSTGGAAAWLPEWSEDAADGLHEARCGAIPNGTNAWLSTIVEGPGTISFKWRSALASRNTKYQFMVDGEVKGMLTGTNGWTEVSISVFGDRAHEIRWRLMTGRSGASADDCAALDEVVWTPTIPPTLAEALNADLVWTTGGDATWRGVARESLTDSRDAWAVVSGLGDDGTAWVQTRVYGSGILLFDWAVSCEEDYDWMELSVDGKVCDYISGDVGWTASAVEIVGDGWHVVRWEYVKDEMDDPELVGENRAMLDNVVWNSDDVAPEQGETQATPVPVPYSELETNFRTYLDAANGDYEAAALMTGRNGYAVWESYVAGLDPDNENSKFTSKIAIVDGKVVVTWDPDTPELRATRTYRKFGKGDICDPAEPWIEIKDGEENRYKFFKVTVEFTR